MSKQAIRNKRKVGPSSKGRCTSGKERFRDKLQGVKALHHAANRRKFALEEGIETKRQEVRLYECSECRGIHLTSRPTWSGTKVGA